MEKQREDARRKMENRYFNLITINRIYRPSIKKNDRTHTQVEANESNLGLFPLPTAIGYGHRIPNQ
jgi:hypothetical protein